SWWPTARCRRRLPRSCSKPIARPNEGGRAMTEPWFDPILYAWIPGTFLGTLGGLWGALMGTLAPRGKGKLFVLASLGILLIASAACLALGVSALMVGQPYGVWYGLLLPGVIGLIVLGSLSPVAVTAYRQAEMRKIQARDM